MKVLFIGGTGIISSACTRLAAEQGIDVYLLNRGQSKRPEHRRQPHEPEQNHGNQPGAQKREQCHCP